MAELVGHNQIVSAGKRGQNAQVDVIAGVEEQRGLAVVKAGQLFLETGAGGRVAGHQAAARAAQSETGEPATGLDFFIKGPAKVGIGGQPQVVVAREVHICPAAGLQAAKLMLDRHERTQLAIEPQSLQSSRQIR